MWDERAKAAIDRSRNGSTGSAIMAQLLAAANTLFSCHWPLFFRSTPHAGTSGVRSCADPPRRLLPDTDKPGSREVLLPPRPLRTVLETCASYGSSIHKRRLRDAAASVNGLHDTRLEPTNRTPGVLPFDGVPVGRTFGSRTSRHFCRRHICLSP